MQNSRFSESNPKAVVFMQEFFAEKRKGTQE
jgi:hypothetical protein